MSMSSSSVALVFEILTRDRETESQGKKRKRVGKREETRGNGKDWKGKEGNKRKGELRKRRAGDGRRGETQNKKHKK